MEFRVLACCVSSVSGVVVSAGFRGLAFRC